MSLPDIITQTKDSIFTVSHMFSSYVRWWQTRWLPDTALECQRKVAEHHERRLRSAREADESYMQLKLGVRVLDKEKYISPMENNMRQWLRYASWSICSDCGLLMPRKLSQRALNDPWNELSKTVKCWRCSSRSNSQYFVPQLEDVPAVFKALPRHILMTLRIFVLHQGSPQRAKHGYFKKDKRSAISWQTATVEQRIHEVREYRNQLLAAYNWLLQNNSAYNKFVDEHNQYLQNPHLWKSRRGIAAQGSLLPPWFIIEPYLEAALWPWLYCKDHWCDSSVHASPQWTPFAQGNCKNTGHKSSKASFSLKLMSRVLDYAADFSLLQFHFDVHIYRTTVSASFVAVRQSISSDTALDSKPWTKLYYRKHHRQLVDAVLQLGDPDGYGTCAPYEWSFPWPYWIEQARHVLGRGPTEIGSLEVIAMAHALQQTILGFVCGTTDDAARWTTYIMGDTKSVIKNNVLLVFLRLEFQEGKHVGAYSRGRGSLHCHWLVWLKSSINTNLSQEILAHAPSTDPPLAALAFRLQRSNTNSRAPQEDGLTRPKFIYF